MKLINNIKFLSVIIALLGVVGCTSVIRPSANPNESDLTKSQIAQLSKRKMHVPCRVEVHCPDSLVGNSNSMHSDYDRYYYPLQDILTNSFNSAIYAAFDQPGGEIVDAFTLLRDCA